MYLDLDEHFEGPECCKCRDKEEKLDNIKYWFKYLLEQVYSQDILNSYELETCLQEIGADVGVKLPEENISVERRVMQKPHNTLTKTIDIDGWQAWNKHYLKQINS